MTSSIRLRSSVQEAARVAHTLSGLGSATELDWMPPTIAPSYIIHESDMDGSFPPSEDLNEHLSPTSDSDTLVAEDDLDDAEDISHDDVILEKASALIHWRLPVSTKYTC